MFHIIINLFVYLLIYQEGCNLQMAANITDDDFTNWSETKLKLEISRYEKKAEKANKMLKAAKASQKEAKYKELQEYSTNIDMLRKALNHKYDNAEENSSATSKHSFVPIKSTEFADKRDGIDYDGNTSVLKRTEEEWIASNVQNISGTEVLYMDKEMKIRELQRMDTMKKTLLKHIEQQSINLEARKGLVAKIDIINKNIHKLQATVS